MKKKIIIYVTPEVQDLIDLLCPSAVIEPYGEGGNSLVSLPERQEQKRKLGFDAYEMAKNWDCTPEEASKRMLEQGWIFQSYDGIFGTELYTRGDRDA